MNIVIILKVRCLCFQLRGRNECWNVINFKRLFFLISYLEGFIMVQTNGKKSNSVASSKTTNPCLFYFTSILSTQKFNTILSSPIFCYLPLIFISLPIFRRQYCIVPHFDEIDELDCGWNLLQF